jgi:hypothetical protein
VISEETVSRQAWREILDEEIERWSSKTYDQILLELQEMQVYEIQRGHTVFTVEVEILTKTGDYVQVSAAVDDGVLPQAIFPASRSFLVRRPGASQEAER